MNLLELRSRYNLSQLQVANELNMSIRTYIRYEKDNDYGNELKRKMMINLLQEKHETTETKGILSFSQIKERLNMIFDGKYKDKVEFCYLFGSYAKGYATETSDVDLCISTSLTGLNFVALSEDIREELNKKIDLIRFSNLENNLELIGEIMKDGIKIYG